MRYYYSATSTLAAFGGFCEDKIDIAKIIESNIFTFLLEDSTLRHTVNFTVSNAEFEDRVFIIYNGKIQENGLKQFFNEKDVKKILVKLNLLGYD